MCLQLISISIRQILRNEKEGINVDGNMNEEAIGKEN